MNKLQQAAKTTLQDCLKITPSETLLIISDDNSPVEVVQALYQAGGELAKETFHHNMAPRQFDGQELPPLVAQALLACDVYLGPTSKSFSHTDARRAASNADIRGATLPGVTTDMFARLMSADYQQIQQQAKKLLSAVNNAKICHITAPNGTDVTLEIPHEFEPDDGLISEPGAFGNLPAGEIMGAPQNVNGIIVIDYMGDIITEATKVEVKDNSIISIEQHPSGKKFQALLDQAASQDGNHNAYQVAELGIGLNPLAQITGNVLEDEKVLGTCHIAFGDNSSYPGGTNTASIHLDGIIANPQIKVDESILTLNPNF